MKNKPKVLSCVIALILCAVMSVPSFADNSTDSPGNINSEVMLTTAGTAFSVTVPTQMPINIALDGTVTTATNAAIVNDSSGPVIVTNVSVNVKNGWSIAEWGKDFSATQIGTKEFTMQLNGANVSTDGSVALTGFPSIASGESLPLTYGADLATQVNAINEGIADVVFTVGWDISGETPSEPDDPEEKPVAYAYVDSETNTMYFDRAASLEEVPEGAKTGFETSTGVASWSLAATKVTSVVFRDTIHPIRTSLWFKGFTNLTTIENSNLLDTSNVTDMSEMFYACKALTTLDVSDWDTSNVTNMSDMFSYCSALTTLDVSNWNTSNVKTMNSTFSDCSVLTTLDVSGWNTSNVTNMRYMFSNCSALTTLDVSNWDTRNVTDMSYMFGSCSALTTIYANDLFRTDNVETSIGMFRNSTNLVGGNGTTYDIYQIDKTYARIDTAEAPGYFTLAA